MHGALNPRSLVRAELDQRRESGYDVAAVDAEIAALGGIDQLSDDDARRLFGALEASVRGADWSYVEPEDLDAIHAESAGAPPAELAVDASYEVRNLVGGMEAPQTATHVNPYREFIGASIRADAFGYVNPGDPVAAADMAHRDAVLSHTANGVYGEMWCAALVAACS